jgi:hypothetical protein
MAGGTRTEDVAVADALEPFVSPWVGPAILVSAARIHGRLTAALVQVS